MKVERVAYVHVGKYIYIYIVLISGQSEVGENGRGREKK
jgi:hypothetical protein